MRSQKWKQPPAEYGKQKLSNGKKTEKAMKIKNSTMLLWAVLLLVPVSGCTGNAPPTADRKSGRRDAGKCSGTTD